MMRASGFFVGALLMLAVFLFFLGAGNQPTLVKEVIRHEVDATPRDIGLAATAKESVEAALDNMALQAADTASLDEESRLVVIDSEPGVNGNGLALDPQSWNKSMVVTEAALRNDTTAVSRYQVWSPFRSEWAAQGFARRLALATDVPMEVVNEAPGNYQVVFNYRDDGERQTLVRHIETVTGLELE